MDVKRHAPATTRNREPILAVLRDVLPARGFILEIASGSGEHTAYFAPHFPTLTWQPSDAEISLLPSIRAWSDDAMSCAAGNNILPPLRLNTVEHPWPVEQADGILAVNMVHISAWESCEGLMSGAGRVLCKGGVLVLYGPFKQAGQHSAPSNVAFDESLRRENPEWGIRDLENVVDLARKNDLSLAQVVPMPANNLCVVFRKADQPSSAD